jgi:hypothetical protein
MNRPEKSIAKSVRYYTGISIFKGWRNLNLLQTVDYFYLSFLVFPFPKAIKLLGRLEILLKLLNKFFGTIVIFEGSK